jgi:hypothetical protein
VVCAANLGEMLTKIMGIVKCLCLCACSRLAKNSNSPQLRRVDVSQQRENLCHTYKQTNVKRSKQGKVQNGGSQVEKERRPPMQAATCAAFPHRHALRSTRSVGLLCHPACQQGSAGA